MTGELEFENSYRSGRASSVVLVEILKSQLAPQLIYIKWIESSLLRILTAAAERAEPCHKRCVYEIGDSQKSASYSVYLNKTTRELTLALCSCPSRISNINARYSIKLNKTTRELTLGIVCVYSGRASSALPLAPRSLPLRLDRRQ